MPEEVALLCREQFMKDVAQTGVLGWPVPGGPVQVGAVVLLVLGPEGQV